MRQCEIDGRDVIRFESSFFRGRPKNSVGVSVGVLAVLNARSVPLESSKVCLKRTPSPYQARPTRTTQVPLPLRQWDFCYADGLGLSTADSWCLHLVLLDCLDGITGVV